MRKESGTVIVRADSEVHRVVERIASWMMLKGFVVGDRGEFVSDFVGLLGSCSAPGSARHLRGVSHASFDNMVGDDGSC